MSRLGSLLTAALASTAVAGDKPAPAWTDGMQAAADGANHFGYELFAQLRGTPGSRFVSPYSVHAAFALLAGGAKGTTRDELVKVLHLPGDSAAAGDLGRFYAGGGKPYELSVANALWGQTGYPWDDKFLARAKERFGAGLEPVDFRADPDGARQQVNKWVAEKTKERIKDLLPAGSVTPRSRLVLANAVYFKGDWADPFKPADTKTDFFTKANGSKASVPLMTRTGRYRYATAGGVQVLELPYKGGDLAMDVILPPDTAGLGAVEEKTVAGAVGWLAKSAEPRRVQVFLPKFKVEDQVSLPPVLKAMGLKEVFAPDTADLTGLVSQTPEDNLSVSDAFHKTFVEVNETGTEAAAATGVVVATRSVEADPVVFRADRPFLFLIRDVQHGTVLFVGRYAGPN